MLGGWWKFWGMSVEVEVDVGGRGKDERGRAMAASDYRFPKRWSGVERKDNRESRRGPMDTKESGLPEKGGDGDGSNGEQQ